MQRQLYFIAFIYLSLVDSWVILVVPPYFGRHWASAKSRMLLSVLSVLAASEIFTFSQPLIHSVAFT